LELARCPLSPRQHRCGYEFTAPVTEEAGLDPEAWRPTAKLHRPPVLEKEQDEHVAGPCGSGLALHYGTGPCGGRALYNLDRHTIREGEYLSITEHDGTLYPSRACASQRRCEQN